MSLGSLARGMLLVWTIALLSGSTAGAEVAVLAYHRKPKVADGGGTLGPNTAPHHNSIPPPEGPKPQVNAPVGKSLTTGVAPAGKVDTGTPKSVPNHPAISPDGTFALLTRSGDHMTTVLSIDGSKVEVTKRNIFAGLSPDAIEITPDGAWAVMANIGMGQGDADTISLIDLKANPPRVADTASVGQSPEHLTISRDGKWIAVSVQNGSNRPGASGFASPVGLVQIYTIKNRKLVKVAEAVQGRWPQGGGVS